MARFIHTDVVHPMEHIGEHFDNVYLSHNLCFEAGRLIYKG